MQLVKWREHWTRNHLWVLVPEVPLINCVDLDKSYNFFERNVKVKSLSRVRLFATPWTMAYHAPLSMGFSRQEYWSGLPFPSPKDTPNPGIEPGSPALQADTLLSKPPEKSQFLYDSFSLSVKLGDQTKPPRSVFVLFLNKFFYLVTCYYPLDPLSLIRSLEESKRPPAHSLNLN